MLTTRQSTTRMRREGGGRRTHGHLRARALGLICLVTVVMVGIAPNSARVAASTSRTSAVSAATAGSHNTPSPTSKTNPLAALQSAYATTTVAPNGLHKTEFSTTPSNYQDSYGAWKPIDNTLEATGSSGWHNTANSWTAQLPPALTGPVSLTKGSATIGFTLAGSASTSTGTASGSTATYANVLTATTVAEQVQSSGIKETLTLANAAAPSTFTWGLDLSSGLSAVQTGTGITIDSAGKPLAQIAAPTVSDAAGISGPATLTLNPDGTSATLAISAAWLSAPGRAFPVTVDPTTSYTSDNLGCVLNQGAPTTIACDSTDQAVGYSGGEIQRTVLDYVGMSEGVLPVDAQISSATIYLGVVSLTGSVTANLYPLSRAYTDGDVNWNTYDGTHSWTTPGGDFTSSPTVSAVVPSAGGTTVFDMPTALVQSWVDGSAPNNGILVKASNESSGTNLATFEPSDNYTGNLVTYWSDNLGAPQGEPIITHTLDDHLSLGVNAANGNLVVHAVDLSINGTGLNEVVDRYYNSEDPTTYDGSQDSWRFGEGEGVYLEVESDNITVYLPGGQPAVFLDNGTSWTTPPGVNAVLSEPTSGHYSLTFNQSQEVIKFATEGSCSGTLLPEASISDRNGESITYGYSASGCDSDNQAFLTSITDTEGRVTTVTNNGSYYTGLSDPQTPTARTVGYAVSSSPYLANTTDTSSNVTHYTYGGTGAQLTQIEDPNGNYTVIAYDSSGRVSSLTYVTNVSAMTGPTYTFAYYPGTSSSPDSGYTTVTDPNSHVTTYYYNSDDIETKVTDANSNSESAGYNADNEPTTLTDAMTSPGVTTNSYDSNNNETESQEPANGSDTAATSYTNYAVGSGHLGNVYLPSSSVNAESSCSLYGYDANGNETDAYTGAASVSGDGEGSNPGCTSGSTYQSHASAGYEGDSGVSCTNAKTGEMCWSKDADGNETTYAYNTSGDLASVTPPTPQGPTTYTYDSLSRTLTSENGDGNDGTPGAITTVQSATTNFGSAASSQTTTLPADTTVGNTLVIAASSDPESPVVSVSSITGGGVSTWHLGEAHSTTTLGDEELWYGYVTTAGSDAVTVNWSAATHNGTEAVELSGVAATSPLDVSAQTSGTSATVNTPSLTTTVAGDVVIDAANALNAVYASPPSPWTDYAGPDDYYYFNPVADQVVGAAGTYSSSWTQSPSGAWLSVGIALKAAADVTSYTYDAMDRVTQIHYGGNASCIPSSGNCISYTYDANGNVVSRTESTGTTTYTYDALNRLIDVGNPGGADACSGSSPAGITYTYDGASNLTASCDALGTTDYYYDAGNRLTSEVEPGGTSGCAVSSHTTETGCTAFSYDNDNHLLVTQFPGGAKQTSTWAPNGKMASIVGANSSGTTETSFVYTYASGTQDEDLVQTRVENDPSVSSATTVTYGYNMNNALTSAVTTGGSSSTLSYYYDAAGNRCSAAASGTPAVCPTGSGDYASNADDELTTSPSGSYTYDAAGNLLSTPQLSNLTYNLKNQTTSVTPSGGSAIASTYSNTGQAERTSDGSTTLVSGTFGVDASTKSGTTTYVIRSNTGTVIGEHVGSTSYYYLHDNLGSVVAVISASGAVQDRDAYDPYGQVTSSSGSTSNPFGYASGYTDSATGLVQFGARYYSPITGTFTQEDPSSQSAGYGYVGEDTVNGTDASGLCSGLACIGDFFSAALDETVEIGGEIFSAGQAINTFLGGNCASEVDALVIIPSAAITELVAAEASYLAGAGTSVGSVLIGRAVC